MALSDKSKMVVKYLQENPGKDLTAADVANALGLEKRSVDGTFTSLQKKEIGYRQEGERMNESGTHDRVKFLRLTELGTTLDPDTYEETK